MTLMTVSLNRGIAARLSGPGGLYNLGNALGLASGVALHVSVAVMPEGAGLTQGLGAVADYLTGSFGATAITFAMLIFFWSGERYHRAWAKGAPPDARLNRVGDISSGWGALALGLGLFLIGQPVLAVTSGLLHALGKFGSALPTRVQARLPFGADVFRLTVVASRLPALLAVLFQLQATVQAHDVQAVVASGMLILCYLLWLKADLALLRG